MRSLSLLLSFWLTLAVGCDPISTTEFRVKPSHTESDSSPASAFSRVERVAEQHGLAFVEQHGNTKLFSDVKEKMGDNPKLWMSVTADHWPSDVEIHEAYISRRTEKHMKLVNCLTKSLQEGGYRITSLTHTDSTNTWPYLLGSLICVLLFAFWVYRRRSAKLEVH